MLSLEQIKDCIEEEMATEFSYWGKGKTVIDNYTGEEEPLMQYLARYYQPIVNTLHKRIEEEYANS